MDELAQSYDRAGRWSKALKLHEQVLALRQKVNGPEHPNTIVAMMSLAIANARAGHLKDGVKKMEEVLALCRRLHGAEHPSTIKAMCGMAGMYAASGRPAESLSLLQGVVRLLCQVNGPDYWEALDALPELAMLYHRVGRLDESIRLINEVLDLERKVRGPTHPVTLTTMQNLALTCFEAGRLEESVKLGEELVLLRRTRSGLEHPATQKAMENLAKSYCSVRRERDAMVLLATLWETNPGNSMAPLVLATLQAWFGPDADYQATRSRFVQQTEGTADRAAKAYCLAPSTDGALLAKALGLARKAVEQDKDNPWVQLGLGIAEYRNGLYASAEKTLTTAEQTAGPSRDIAGTARLYRALSILRQGRTEEALRLFRQIQIQAQMPPFPKDESNPFADIKPRSQNHDLLIWWLVYKEAKGELEQPPGAKP
jgi:tetratricopeptide (TPR) repeat protein